MKKLLPFLIGLFYVGTSLAQNCSDKYLNDLYDDVEVETVKFGESTNDQGELQELMMDIYTGVGNEEANKPVMILAFGGAFIAGERSSPDMQYFATEFAKKGYLCASIDYRIASSFFSLLSEENLVKIVLSAAHDGKAAIRYFRQDANTENRYKIDTSAIFIGGTSAGGILASHVAYLDTEEKLPEAWKGYIADLPNGLEGESGNPGYCSVPNGVFQFAGALADTSWIEANDVPIYSTHSTADATVPYDSGQPLNGIAPVTLFGGNAMFERMSNINTFTVFDSYESDAHPPFNTDNQAVNDVILADVENNLAEFLNQIIHCNPNNQLPMEVQNCENSSTVGIQDRVAEEVLIYPNPASRRLYIKANDVFTRYSVFSTQGQRVLQGSVSQTGIDISALQTGHYIVQLEGRNRNIRQPFIKQ